MANTVLKDKNGPDWPLGWIQVVTPGTPVNIMSLVDPNSLDAPQTATPGTAGANEYTVRFNQMVFQGFKPGASHGMVNNTGNVYVVRYAARTTGSGNRDDTGVIVGIIAAGGAFEIVPSSQDRNVYNPYRYYIDADNAGDGAIVVGIVQ